MKILKIEIPFPVFVELPPGFEQTLDALVGMVCKAYEKENPDRVMWPAGIGAKPIWREPEEPQFDSSILEISVEEREASEREINRRKQRSQ